MAFFGLFNKTLPTASLGILRTDIHSHFIPGIDDGSKDTAESLQMLEEMITLGYKKIITTPHIISDSYKNTPEIIMHGLEKLKKAALNAELPIDIEAAAEYYVDFEFEKAVKANNKLLTFGKKNYLLWEMSFMNPPDKINETVFELQMRDYKPVLAHVERYPYWQKDYSKYEEMKDRNVLLQMNLYSLGGYYGPETRKASHWLIDKDMISFLGSDCHHAGYINGLKEILTDKYLHKLLASTKLLNATL